MALRLSRRLYRRTVETEETETSALNTVLGATPSAGGEPQCSGIVPPANHTRLREVRLCPVEWPSSLCTRQKTGCVWISNPCPQEHSSQICILFGNLWLDTDRVKNLMWCLALARCCCYERGEPCICCPAGLCQPAAYKHKWYILLTLCYLYKQINKSRREGKTSKRHPSRHFCIISGNGMLLWDRQCGMRLTREKMFCATESNRSTCSLHVNLHLPKKGNWCHVPELVQGICHGPILYAYL